MQLTRVVVAVYISALLSQSLRAASTTAPSVERVVDPARIRADFRKMIDRPRVPLDPVVRPMDRDDPDLWLSHLTFVSEPGQVVPALMMAPRKAVARRPVVIVLHGTGSRKEDNLDMLRMLAGAGFIAVSPDGRFHGERCAAGRGTDAYYAAITQAFDDGRSHPWLYDTVFDVTRLIDYLQGRPDVDAHHIGVMGFSKGGMEAYLAAAVDTRIAAAAACISVQSFRWGLDHDRWHDRIGTVKGGFLGAARHANADPSSPVFVRQFYDRVVPGIDSEFDCPAMLQLICPRPLLAVSGELDPINPLPGALLAGNGADAAYAAAGVPERFKFVVEPGVGHDVKPMYRREIVAWFSRVLLTR